ncbi:hypothetical protein Kpol_1028p13 [Vanderwaltozyma polyspora DSM 70294]|uniref:Mso1 N-terminal domain-containing protein n=1 Tax=Vanderwaltozyma polyspora (strain ATCC 22028 / DSM 70294 / BCRC 21397 / CBS 2163 / NBRC 10782 / NRRL Y-8283 / UCD 57-17) TaxID=436907 RepID=A7TFY3_VANPO|nr:uncharacterized protein Kpol_1028p13 [Vanderwaltozyma polyspora DSM 70294]EDO18740.1 hypothetical protein Kpol_1028p13 [Vanderwaltozyma polyspora DSM 70294]
MSSNGGSENLWNKFTKSTKNISTSLSHLSIKTESDGSTIESTLVHKAMVNFYKNQEPFQGFPGWLGHKDDLPDEKKILKKQMQSSSTVNNDDTASSEPQSSKNNGWKFSSSESKKSNYVNLLDQSDQIEQPKPQLQKKPTAGMAFQSIYNSANTVIRENEPLSSSPVNRGSASNTPVQTDGSGTSTPQGNPSRTQSSSSLMMRDRLKRTHTRGSYGF